ncbi:MAG: SpoIIE family protein phosphatase [Pirellulaceae bacterium]|nr:SpoIIE family protein phosphatase [Planctomycetales bacterium]
MAEISDAIVGIPSYLKLHSEEAVDSAAIQNVVYPEVGKLCHAFEVATGWSMQYATHGESATASRHDDSERIWSMSLPAVDGRRESSLSINKRGAGSLSPSEQIPRHHACRLATHIGQLLGELHRTQHALWRSEAELAASIPLIGHSDEEESHWLAARLEAILRNGTDAVAAHAASLYLLDDATSTLKLRAASGLPLTRFCDAPRELRTAIADLEALANHAVVISDVVEYRNWNLPETSFASCVCVPVATTTVPIGTLWIHSALHRHFDQADVNIIDIVAGRLASELEREVLLREARQSRTTTVSVPRTSKATVANPVFPVIDGWQLAAGNVRGAASPYELAYWHVGQDDQLKIAALKTYEDEPNSARHIPLLEGVLSATASTADLASVVACANETLWSRSSGDGFVESFLGQLEPKQGKLRFIKAGGMVAFLIHPHAWQALGSDTPSLGTDPEIGYAVESESLSPGDVLLVLSASEGMELHELDGRELVGIEFAELLLRHNHLSAEEMLQLVSQLWRSQAGFDDSSAVALVLKHEANST